MQETSLPKYYSNRKKVCSFKGDPTLWKDFEEGVWAKGLNVCFVLETFMIAWLKGSAVNPTSNSTMIINMNVQHIVERPRRKSEPELCIPNYYKCQRKIFKLLDEEFKRGERP